MMLKQAKKVLKVWIPNLTLALTAYLATLLTIAGPVQADYMHSLSQDQAYQDNATMFPSSGYIEVDNGAGVFAHGSGVLVAPNWVLTAAHVAQVLDGNGTFLNNQFTFGTGSNYNTNRGMTYTSAEVYIHPTYAGLKFGRDLALIHFQDSILDIPTANLYEGPKEIGRDAYIVSHGQSGTIAGTDAAFTDGAERAGVNLVDGLEFGVLSPDFISSAIRGPGDPDFRTFGILPGPGGSGGGWYYDINGQWQLAGVTSLSSTVRIYDVTTAAAFIDTPWVKSFTAVPEPGSIILVTIAGFKFLRHRRRRTILPE